MGTAGVHPEIDESPPCETLMEPQPFSSLGSVPSWQPGVLQRLPWLALGSLLLAFLFTMASVIVLVKSNGQLVDHWTYSPALLMAIFSALSNACIGYGFSQGVKITWWKQALQGVDLGALHDLWSYGDSLFDAVCSLHHIRPLAVASIMSTVFLAQGPLFQRASSVTTIYQRANTTLEAHILPQWTLHTTTSVSQGELDGPSFTYYTPSFIEVIRNYTDREPIVSGIKGCAGTCHAEIAGAGYHIECTQNTTDVNYKSLEAESMKLEGHVGSAQVFAIHIDSPESESHSTLGSFLIDVEYSVTDDTMDDGCPGVKTTKTCVVRPGLVSYPIQVINNTISLVPSPPEGYQSHPLQESPKDKLVLTYHLMGFPMMLQDLFDTSVTLEFPAGEEFILRWDNYVANYFVQMQESTCGIHSRDPTDFILHALHQLAFRFALAQAGANDTQAVAAVDVSPVAIFHSHYVFLALAVGVSVLTILAILPTLDRWWILGRKVSLSPLETARAFNAPLLRDVDSNSSVEQLARAVRHRPVQYGVVDVAMDDGIPEQDAPRDTVVGSRLEIASPHLVRRLGNAASAQK
jgi:hypothetical protein